MNVLVSKEVVKTKNEELEEEIKNVKEVLMRHRRIERDCSNTLKQKDCGER